MGLLNKNVLPDHIDEPGEWKGTDDDQYWYMRWRLHVKHWFAFGWKGEKGLDITLLFFPFLYVLPFTYWFTGWNWLYLFPVFPLLVERKWREFPTVLFAVRGRGYWRWENSDASEDYVDPNNNRVIFWHTPTDGSYLSRVQYWTRWQVAWLWPWFIQWHVCYDPSKMPKVGFRSQEKKDGIVMGYRGWHRDGDAYWGDSGFLGGVWK